MEQIVLSEKFRTLAEQTIEEETNAQPTTLLRDYYIKCFKQAEADGVPKHRISETVKNTLNEIKTKKVLERNPNATKKECFINEAWYYQIAKKAGVTNPYYARHTKVDPATGSKNTSTKEKPEGIEFEILELFGTISKYNASILAQIFVKTTFDKDAILRSKLGKTDEERADRLESARELIEGRRKIIKEQLEEFFKTKDLKKVKPKLQRIITEQKKLETYFDDRMSLTHFQKVMAKFAVDLGYDKNEIARFLQITSKHMKVNIYAEEVSHDLLLLLEWFDRCPGCGVKLSEIIESKIEDRKKEKPLEYFDYEIEPLKMTSYQEQYAKVKEDNRLLKLKLKELQSNG